MTCLPSLLHAQIDPGGDVDAPIDGGLSILLLAGIGYGIKKIRNLKKDAPDPPGGVQHGTF